MGRVGRRQSRQRIGSQPMPEGGGQILAVLRPGDRCDAQILILCAMDRGIAPVAVLRVKGLL